MACGQVTKPEILEAGGFWSNRTHERGKACNLKAFVSEWFLERTESGMS
jgi:hypothetical protein